MAIREFRLPDPGEGLVEADMSPGGGGRSTPGPERHRPVEVETSKSLVESARPYAGTVPRAAVAEGTRWTSAPIIAIDDGADAPAEAAPRRKASIPRRGAERAETEVDAVTDGNGDPGGGCRCWSARAKTTEAKRRPRKASAPSRPDGRRPTWPREPCTDAPCPGGRPAGAVHATRGGEGRPAADPTRWRSRAATATESSRVGAAGKPRSASWPGPRDGPRATHRQRLGGVITREDVIRRFATARRMRCASAATCWFRLRPRYAIASKGVRKATAQAMVGRVSRPSARGGAGVTATSRRPWDLERSRLGGSCRPAAITLLIISKASPGAAADPGAQLRVGRGRRRRSC